MYFYLFIIKNFKICIFLKKLLNFICANCHLLSIFYHNKENTLKLNKTKYFNILTFPLSNVKNITFLLENLPFLTNNIRKNNDFFWFFKIKKKYNFSWQ